MSSPLLPRRGFSAARPNHLFVDAVRFWSMVCVVALHSIQNFKMFFPSDETLAFPLICLTKIGTIGFFLISGFLLGERIDAVAPLPYLSRRLKNLLLPWGFWFGSYVFCLLIRHALTHRLALTSAGSWFHALFADVMSALFESSFWFVPNLAFGMCVLLLFRRHLYSVKFGLVLFAVNLIYVANLYGRWFFFSHTTAFFGFICYLWLGSFAARNFFQFQRMMDRVRIKSLAVLCLLGWGISYAEAHLLFGLSAPDPTSTLRLSNQVLSVLIVLLVFKLKSVSWPGFVDVRQQTFGIYLIHWFYLRMAVRGLMRLVALSLPHVSIPPFAAFLLCGVVFVFTYGASLLTTRWLAGASGLRWTVGLKSPVEARARTQQLIAM